MGSTEAAFLREGIEKFPEAYRALHYFNQIMVEQVEAALRRLHWGCGLSLNGKVAPELGGRELDCWSSGVLTGTLGETVVRLDIGLWWSAPGTDGRPIVYVNPCSGVSLPTAYTPTEPAITCAQIRQHVRLYLPLTKDSDVEKAFAALLDELDRALAKQGATVAPGLHKDQ